MPRKELVVSTRWALPLVPKARPEFGPFQGPIASAPAGVALDPALGGLGLSLCCHSCRVGEASLSLVHRVGCALGCLLGPVVSRLVAFHSFVCRSPRTVIVLPSLSPASMMAVASACPGPSRFYLPPPLSLGRLYIVGFSGSSRQRPSLSGDVNLGGDACPVRGRHY